MSLDGMSDASFIINKGNRPLVNFNFIIRVELLYDLPCKSVKAFTRELEYDYIQEGGLNDYVHMRRKPITKPFVLEIERYACIDVLDPLPLGADLALPVILFVSRYVNQFAPSARMYVFTGCTVIKKVYGELIADRSGLLTDTITLAYREMLCVESTLLNSLNKPEPNKVDNTIWENWKKEVEEKAREAEKERKRLEDARVKSRQELEEIHRKAEKRLALCEAEKKRTTAEREAIQAELAAIPDAKDAAVRKHQSDRQEIIDARDEKFRELTALLGSLLVATDNQTRDRIAEQIKNTQTDIGALNKDLKDLDSAHKDTMDAFNDYENQKKEDLAKAEKAENNAKADYDKAVSEEKTARDDLEARQRVEDAIKDTAGSKEGSGVEGGGSKEGGGVEDGGVEDGGEEEGGGGEDGGEEEGGGDEEKGGGGEEEGGGDEEEGGGGEEEGGGDEEEGGGDGEYITFD